MVSRWRRQPVYGTPLIVIDFGTATTFDCVDARGAFIGGAIAPGIMTAADGLLSRAARLYRVELVRPPAAIGRNTVTNIQSGVIYGYAGLVDGLVERMRRRWREPPGGGHGRARRAHRERATSIDRIENPDLTLEGLRMLFERAGRGTR